MSILEHIEIPAITFSPILDTTVILLSIGSIIGLIIKFSYSLIKKKMKNQKIKKNINSILKDLYDKSNYKKRNLFEMIYDDSLTLYIENLQKNIELLDTHKDKREIWNIIGVIKANESNRDHIKPHVNIKNNGYKMSALNKSPHFQSYENNIKIINEKISSLLNI